MKLKKWKAILNSKDYLNCIGQKETRKFQMFKVTSPWAGGKYTSANIKDEAMYIGRVRILINNGKKSKYLYFQSDYTLQGGPKIEDNDDEGDTLKAFGSEG